MKHFNAPFSTHFCAHFCAHFPRSSARWSAFFVGSCLGLCLCFSCGSGPNPNLSAAPTEAVSHSPALNRNDTFPADWKIQREAIRQSWLKALGTPSSEKFTPTVTYDEEFENSEFRAQILWQKNGPETRQKMLLMKPKNLTGKVPAFVVPFYDCDRMCGYFLDSKKRMPPGREYAEFARLLVREGYVVLCVEAYPFNIFGTPINAAQNRTMQVWKDAASKLSEDHPNWSGVGKLTADVRLAVDFLLQQECVDSRFVGTAGHSLGGKMAFYAGALDDRVSIIWASDFGIRWEDTNWHDPWYWGTSKLETLKKLGMDHASLLKLHAPGHFILIAGEADGEKSLPLLEEAQKAFQFCSADESRHIFLLNHASGHQPTKETVEASLKLIRKIVSEKK